jgi:hypothetical protein
MSVYKSLLLTPGQRQQGAWRGLLNVGQALSAAGAPSTMPTSTMGAFSKGLAAYAPGYDQYANDMRGQKLQNTQYQMQQQQMQQQQMAIDAAKRKKAREEEQYRAQDAYSQMQGENTRPDGTGASRADMIRRAYPALFAEAEIEQMMPSSSMMPMSIKEWGAFQSMTPEDQEKYLNMKRAQQYIDIGGSVVAPSLTNPTNTSTVVAKTLSPGDTPEIKRAQAEAAAIGAAEGKEKGDVSARLSSAMATYPKLQGVVKRLKDLGKVASYTWTDRASDEASIQLGGDASEGAVARGEYIATVKNNILPLLRQTFGPAFTVQEGESLLSTLGDPNMHPSVKDAVLDSFIAQKTQDIDAMKRQVGGDSSVDLKSRYGLE